MNWKPPNVAMAASEARGCRQPMNAKDYLEQLEKLDTIIINKMVEKLKWLDVANGITAHFGGERVQSSGSKQKMADALDIAADIDMEIRSLRTQKEEISRTIQQLNATEYDVIHKRYIQGMSFADIGASKKPCKSESWATTVHGRALKNLQHILDIQEQGWADSAVAKLQNM